MANGMLRRSGLCLIALVLGVPALAASKDGIATSKDGRQTFASRPSGFVHGADIEAGPGPTVERNVIYNNISAYPLGRYWCCTGWTISGPNSPIANTYAAAMPFTPASNATVARILVGVGYVTGTNGATISVNEDNGGLPGNVIQSFDVSGLPPFGTCCTLEVVNANIPVSAGTRYWVVVATSNNTSDTWDAWNMNDTNETAQSFAFFNNGIWQAATGILGAFGVFAAH